VTILRSILTATLLSVAASAQAATDACTTSTIPCSSATSRSILADGSQFVPLGIWYDHAGVEEPARSENLIRAIDDIASRGMNLIVIYWLPEGEAGSQIMTYAQSKGVRVMPYLEWHEDFKAAAQEWKVNPGLFGWFVQDDSNSPSTRRCDLPDKKSVWQSNGTKNRAAVRAGGDHGHVTLISPQARSSVAAIESTSTGVVAYQSCAELLATQSYPWTGDSNPWGEKVSDVFYHGKASRQLANKYNQGYLRAVQAWRHDSLSGDPSAILSPALLRNMAWQGIASGAQGLIWYAYQDETWRLAEHPQLLDAIKAFTDELKPYTAYASNGRAVRYLSTGSTSVVASSIPHRNGDSMLVIIANTAKALKTYTITPPGSEKMTGQLPAYDVKVFELPIN
jgi:hypothetical protein